MNADTDLVIFGAKGDLSRRKLFPALYHLDKDGLLPKGLRILGLAREETDTDGFIASIKERLESSDKLDTLSEKAWERFAERLVYVKLDLLCRKTLPCWPVNCRKTAPVFSIWRRHLICLTTSVTTSVRTVVSKAIAAWCWKNPSATIWKAAER